LGGVYLIDGVRVIDIKKNIDERGFFAEVARKDWGDFFEDQWLKQVNLTYSYPGIIRAWHRHEKGQIDHFMVLKGSMKIVIYDDRKSSKTKGELNEFVLSGEKLQVIRVPGACWHGTKTVSSEPSISFYFVNNLYDYKNPDEERVPWNSDKIIDSKTGKPYDWNKSPHK